MDYRDETEAEHRARDRRTWTNWLLLSWLAPGLRWLWVPVLVAVAAAWLMNILGESTVLNDPEIYYSGKDPRTGEVVVVKGCRPEKVLPDGGCDKSITWATVRKAFPHWGPPRKVPQ